MFCFWQKIVVLLVLLGVALSGRTQPELLSQCSECHGAQGEVSGPGKQPLANMPREVLVNKLKGYRQQLVPDSIMARSVHDLTDQQIEWLADYYSNTATEKNKP